MAMAPFLPKGTEPEWEKVYRYLESLQVDDVITYAELDECLERDFRLNRNPLYPAIRNLQREHHKTLVPVVGKGYRVAAAKEHTEIAKGKHKRARKQLDEGVQILEATDRRDLSNSEIARLERMEELYGRQAEALRKQQRQLDKLERRGEANDAKIDEMAMSIEELISHLKKKGNNASEA